MKIKELIKSLDTCSTVSLARDFRVKGISCNSKDVKDGFVFVAVKGAKADGSLFIDEALKQGAKVVVVQNGQLTAQLSKKTSVIAVRDTRRASAQLAAKFYGNPSTKIKVAGITGTNGKTTVSYLIEAILKEAGLSPSVIGTINYRFKGRVIPSKNTTPGPVELQSLLADMHRSGADYAIMEVSSHALDQDRTEGVRFHSAVFTNLTQDHLDYHKTLNNYYKAKEKLFKILDAKAFAVINSDEKYGLKIKKCTKADVVTYGINGRAHVTAKDLEFDCRETRFQLSTPAGKIRVSSPLIGLHNVYNVLAAAAWADKEGIALKVIKSAIEKFAPVPGRLERIDFSGDFEVFVDYAHTEDALKNVITGLKGLCERRIIVVFGCGGERDKTKRPKMGRAVCELADYAVITSDNPRSEDPKKIIGDIKKGIRKRNFCVVPSRFEAIKKSLSIAKGGDMVIVAGKGHENYQILKEGTIHFDDREVIRQCLNSMNY